MCINVFGIVRMIFWFVNVLFQGLYDMLVFGWISDRFGLQTTRGKKFGGKGQRRIRPELGRIALEIFGSGQLLSGLNPARNLTENLARFLPDCDAAGTVHVRRRSFVFVSRILNRLSALLASGMF